MDSFDMANILSKSGIIQGVLLKENGHANDSDKLELSLASTVVLYGHTEKAPK